MSGVLRMLFGVYLLAGIGYAVADVRVCWRELWATYTATNAFLVLMGIVFCWPAVFVAELFTPPSNEEGGRDD